MEEVRGEDEGIAATGAPNVRRTEDAVLAGGATTSTNGPLKFSPHGHPSMFDFPLFDPRPARTSVRLSFVHA